MGGIQALGTALMDGAEQQSVSVGERYRKASKLDVLRHAQYTDLRPCPALRSRSGAKKACFFVFHLMLRGPAGPPFDD
jgi:hypothetical protein